MRTTGGRTDRVVVVGAGLAGLSAAMHLAGRGRDVTVVERSTTAGGRTGRLAMSGYTLDTGPTVLTMPHIAAEAFAAVGTDMAEVLPLTRLDPAYTARFADGSQLEVHSDGDRMAQAVREFAGADEAAGYLALREWLSTLYRVQFDRFIASNIDSPFAMVSTDLARLIAMGGFRRLDSMIGSFLGDERLRRVFSFQALYAGESPMRALALYAVIAYMDTVAGVYFPRGGMGELPRTMAAAAARAGVCFRYDTAAAELERDGSRVAAVHTDLGERIACDAVVLATELVESYRLLARSPARLVPLRAAPSAFVLHAGTSGAWPEVGHHTVSFGRAWGSTFDELITRGQLMTDPSLLITRPTATDTTLAPPGRQLFSVLAPVPNLERGSTDWDLHSPRYADTLVELLRERMLPGLQLDVSHVLSPADWARQGMVSGTPFSYAHTFTQTGPFRPGNLPRGVDNVVLAGGGTVPGVGVPTVLISGRLAADRITGGSRATRRTTIGTSPGTVR